MSARPKLWIGGLLLNLVLLAPACAETSSTSYSAAPSPLPPLAPAPTAEQPVTTPTIVAHQPTPVPASTVVPFGAGSAQSPIAPGPETRLEVASDIEDFTLADLTVEVGTRVVWTNRDSVRHTTTSGSQGTKTGVWNASPLAEGMSFAFAFLEEGTFQYFCAIHPGSMNATVTVVVEGALGPSATPPQGGVAAQPSETARPPSPLPAPVVAPNPTVTPASLTVSGSDASMSPILDFTLENLFVEVGATITWENWDPEPHTSTSGVSPDQNGVWDSGILDTGESFGFTFQEPGEYSYYCTIHPFMTATIAVADGNGPAQPIPTPPPSPVPTALPLSPVPTPAPPIPLLPTSVPPAPLPLIPPPPTPEPPTPTPSASIQSVTVGSSKDNTLYESSAGALSNSAGQYMFVGNTAGGLGRRAVITFGLSRVPDDATVNSVTLTLEMNKTSSGEQTVKLHRLTSDWGEASSKADGNQGGGTFSEAGDATWLHTFADTTKWTSDGGDFDNQISALTVVTGRGSYQWSSDQMTADVQGWLNDRSGNFGWVLIGNESMSKTTKRFDTKESAGPSRPTLTIEFTP